MGSVVSVIDDVVVLAVFDAEVDLGSSHTIVVAGCAFNHAGVVVLGIRLL